MVFLPSAFLLYYRFSFFFLKLVRGGIPPVGFFFLYCRFRSFFHCHVFSPEIKINNYFLKQGLIKPYFLQHEVNDQAQQQEANVNEQVNLQISEDNVNDQAQQQEANDNDQVNLQLSESEQQEVNDQNPQQDINDTWCKCCNYSYCLCRTDSRNKKPGRKRHSYCCVCGKYKCKTNKYGNYMSQTGFLFNWKGELGNRNKIRKMKINI